MNRSKNIVFAFLILSIILLSLVFSLLTPKASGFVEEITIETTQPSLPERLETIPPTEPEVEESVLDYSIQYIKLEEESNFLNEINRCESYLINLLEELLNYPKNPEVLEAEVIRIRALITQYQYDLKFLNKQKFNVPEEYKIKDFKSYEDYRAITYKNSPHYKLQNEYAITGIEGIRKVDDRYCIALGSYFTTTIGQYIDIVLENGTIIPCILGDQKSDRHTDELHIAHLTDGSVVEFIVDLDVLDNLPRKMGNVSYVYEEWKSPVAQIIVYDLNFFNMINE